MQPKPIDSRLVRRSKSQFRVLLLASICAISAGCQITTETGARRVAYIASLGTPNAIHVTPVRRHPELAYLKQFVGRAPQPSERTQQLLRRYNLATRYADDPAFVIHWMKDICHNSANMEEVHALAEIALIQADWAAQKQDVKTATELYATAIVHAYQFLFDSKLDVQRNAFDPQFRSICDIYNQSLEGMLRLVCDSDKLQLGKRHVVGEGDMMFEFTVEIEGRWKDERFVRFELTNDYKMKGIENLYHTYGLGVPLIAVPDASETKDPTAKYYPPRLTLPLTAFCEVLPPQETTNAGPPLRKAVLKLYDPLEQTSILLGGRAIPLESDITTPLAYHLNDPLLNTGVLATAAMINANVAKDIYGLYMLEPFDPDKIPVVMVHGFWSSPTTWMEMFNDLRANKDLRNNYQFWFYSYPTGQPFWISARQMRNDLAEAKAKLDPEGNSPSFNQMVLVGHSMGGLVSRLQTISSGDRFWKIVSNGEFGQLDGDQESLDILRDTFFFEPNPAVKRVITIATPLHGSKFANSATKWAGQKLFTLPELVTQDMKSVVRKNESLLENPQFLTMTTSIDSLSPESPFFAAIAAAPQSPDVTYNNIVGKVPSRALWIKTGLSTKNGDGVVELESARATDVQSQIEVPEEHSHVHQHPKTILEVRRILLEHLVQFNRIKDPQLPVIPTGFEDENGPETGVRQVGGAEY
jgi:hypothetical protein